MKLFRFIVLPALVVAVGIAATTAGAVTLTPVMSGLDNPRGLAFGYEGSLFVAEAGRGGSGPCLTLRGAPQCYGPTGRVSRLRNGVQSHAITGLPSLVATTGPDTGSATGPHDIAFAGPFALIPIGWGADPALRNLAPQWRQFGHLAVGNPFGTGSWSLGADVSAYDSAANPDGGPADSNPYGMLWSNNAGALMTDAGGNDLIRVAAPSASLGAGISTLAVFPSRSTTPPHPSCPFPGFPPVTDSVPTSIAVGPDGAYYVGELTGAPFCAGFANVYRVTTAGSVSAYCGGFTTIIDLTWGPDGSLYVLQHSNGPVFFATPGNVVRVGPGCTKTPVTPALNRPGSLAFGPDGKLYVSVNSDQVGTGQVVRVDP
jgi:hypothetical protein